MPEAPAPQDTPAVPAPDGTPPPPEINYQQRYDDLRPQFDRTNQEAAELRAEMQRVATDEEYQRQLMTQWGYDIDEPDAQAPDPSEELRAQLAELQEWKNATTAEQQQRAQLNTITTSVDEQFRNLAPDLDDSTKEWITTRALNMDAREDGMPDIYSAHKAFTDWELARQKAWASGKRAAPRISANGAEGTQAPNLDDRQARVAFMAQQLDAMNADT
jgi:hypothetical protein